MPKFIISRARIVVPLLLAVFIALMCAGPGTIILLAAAPGSVKILGRVVCPAGASMNARWVRYSYSRPGESSLEITCAGEDRSTSVESTWWFAKLFGLYLSVLLLPLFYVFLKGGGSAKRPAALPRLSPESELEVRNLIAGGRKIDAIKRVRDLKGVSLEAAKDYVESLPETSVTRER